MERGGEQRRAGGITQLQQAGDGPAPCRQARAGAGAGVVAAEDVDGVAVDWDIV